MSYTRTLRDVIAGKAEPKFKGTANVAQLEALENAGESYHAIDRSNVGAQTKQASERLDGAYSRALAKTAEAESEAVSAAGALKSAREQYSAAVKTVEEKLVSDIDAASKKDIIKSAEAELTALRKPDAKTAAEVITSKETALKDLKSGVDAEIAKLRNGAAEQTKALEDAAKKAHEPLEAAASKTAKRHARLDKRTGQIADVEHKFNRGEAEIKPAKNARKVVDGKLKAVKVGNDPKVAASYKELDAAFDAVVDKSKLGAAPKYAQIAAGSSASVAHVVPSSLEEAHSLFAPFKDISAEVRTGDRLKDLHGKYNEALAAVQKEPGVAEKLSTLTKAHGDFKAHEVAKTLDSEAGKAAKAAYDAAQNKVTEALKVTDTSSEAVKKFAEVSKEAGKLQGNLGNLKAQGVWGAAKSHLTPSAPGNSWGRVAIRGGVSLAGGAMTLDAFRSKTSDGQDRSWVTRTAEGLVGVGALAGGVLVGKARI